MNGCLGKTLLIATVVVALFASYPFVKKFLSEETQDKLNQMETSGSITGKIIKAIGVGKAEKFKKDNLENDNPEN